MITSRPDHKIDLGMYDPLNERYEALGSHGPSRADVDKAIRDLKHSIERAGHRLTFCERSV